MGDLAKRMVEGGRAKAAARKAAAEPKYKAIYPELWAEGKKATSSDKGGPWKSDAEFEEAMMQSYGEMPPPGMKPEEIADWEKGP